MTSGSCCWNWTTTRTRSGRIERPRQRTTEMAPITTTTGQLFCGWYKAAGDVCCRLIEPTAIPTRGMVNSKRAAAVATWLSCLWANILMGCAGKPERCADDRPTPEELRACATEGDW